MPLPHTDSAPQVCEMAPCTTVSSGVTEPLESALHAVECQLDALSTVLSHRSPDAIDQRTKELHQALAHTLDVFTSAARRGGVPRELRQRLIKASAQVATLRDALARASASLDRALGILLPDSAEPTAAYAASAYTNTRRSTHPTVP